MGPLLPCGRLATRWCRDTPFGDSERKEDIVLRSSGTNLTPMPGMSETCPMQQP